MITVTPIGPPPGFALKVVKPAKAWATRKGWPWNAPPPVGKANELPAKWTACLDDLHRGYAGICAYLSVYTHRSEQASSVDHFVPKSVAPLSEAYNWSNFRLASRPMNTNKDDFQDVLDPFTLPAELFTLNLLNGRVSINRSVASPGSVLHQQAVDTLNRLKLNLGQFRSLRLEFIDEYLRQRQMSDPQALQLARAQLRARSPFIFQEVIRQGW
jgi:hypothetical protein